MRGNRRPERNHLNRPQPDRNFRRRYSSRPSCPVPMRFGKAGRMFGAALVTQLGKVERQSELSDRLLVEIPVAKNATVLGIGPDLVHNIFAFRQLRKPAFPPCRIVAKHHEAFPPAPDLPEKLRQPFPFRLGAPKHNPSAERISVSFPIPARRSASRVSRRRRWGPVHSGWTRPCRAPARSSGRMGRWAMNELRKRLPRIRSPLSKRGGDRSDASFAQGFGIAPQRHPERGYSGLVASDVKDQPLFRHPPDPTTSARIARPPACPEAKGMVGDERFELPTSSM